MCSLKSRKASLDVAKGDGGVELNEALKMGCSISSNLMAVDKIDDSELSSDGVVAKELEGANLGLSGVIEGEAVAAVST